MIPIVSGETTIWDIEEKLTFVPGRIGHARAWSVLRR
jgi:hypothetical protein